MIVNLIGPPCAGKSWIASKYTLDHPSWRYTSIDACRVEEKEESLAWEVFERTLDKAPLIVAESSGMSWRFPDILERQRNKGRPILTLGLIAEAETLHQRLEQRHHKRPIPYRLRMDEKQSIDWVLQNLDQIEYPVDEYIRTDSVSKEELYNHVSEKIRKYRLSAVEG